MQEAIKTFSVNETAKRFNCCSQTIRKWIKEGKLEAVKGMKTGFVGNPGYQILEDSIEELWKKLNNVTEEDERKIYIRNKLDEMSSILDKMAKRDEQYANQRNNDIFCLRIGIGQITKMLEG